ncbi:MAG: DedA family protein [Deltaproteobacteria bacterium]|nr:MAG: DedA family protein [Deltaproteobacteria bacterium]
MAGVNANVFQRAWRTVFAPLRRLYNWILAWAKTPWGPLVLFVVAIAEASFLPIPADPLLIALCLGNRRKSLYFAGLCTVGSVIGGLLGYLVGMLAFETLAMPILEIYGKGDAFEPLAEGFRDQGAIAVLLAAITPVPYKLVTLTAGAVGVDLMVFTGASLLGRGVRFLAVAALIYWLGERMARFIERWFELLAVSFAVLVVGGLLLFRYLL